MSLRFDITAVRLRGGDATGITVAQSTACNRARASLAFQRAGAGRCTRRELPAAERRRAPDSLVCLVRWLG